MKFRAFDFDYNMEANIEQQTTTTSLLVCYGRYQGDQIDKNRQDLLNNEPSQSKSETMSPLEGTLPTASLPSEQPSAKDECRDSNQTTQKQQQQHDTDNLITTNKKRAPSKVLPSRPPTKKPRHNPRRRPMPLSSQQLYSVLRQLQTRATTHRLANEPWKEEIRIQSRPPTIPKLALPRTVVPSFEMFSFPLVSTVPIKALDRILYELGTGWTLHRQSRLFSPGPTIMVGGTFGRPFDSARCRDQLRSECTAIVVYKKAPIVTTEQWMMAYTVGMLALQQQKQQQQQNVQASTPPGRTARQVEEPVNQPVVGPSVLDPTTTNETESAPSNTNECWLEQEEAAPILRLRQASVTFAQAFQNRAQPRGGNDATLSGAKRLPEERAPSSSKEEKLARKKARKELKKQRRLEKKRKREAQRAKEQESHETTNPSQDENGPNKKQATQTNSFDQVAKTRTALATRNKANLDIAKTGRGDIQPSKMSFTIQTGGVVRRPRGMRSSLDKPVSAKAGTNKNSFAGVSRFTAPVRSGQTISAAVGDNSRGGVALSKPRSFGLVSRQENEIAGAVRSSSPSAPNSLASKGHYSSASTHNHTLSQKNDSQRPSSWQPHNGTELSAHPTHQVQPCHSNNGVQSFHATKQSRAPYYKGGQIGENGASEKIVASMTDGVPRGLGRGQTNVPGSRVQSVHVETHRVPIHDIEVRQNKRFAARNQQEPRLEQVQQVKSSQGDRVGHNRRYSIGKNDPPQSIKESSVPEDKRLASTTMQRTGDRVAEQESEAVATDEPTAHNQHDQFGVLDTINQFGAGSLPVQGRPNQAPRFIHSSTTGSIKQHSATNTKVPPPSNASRTQGMDSATQQHSNQPARFRQHGQGELIPQVKDMQRRNTLPVPSEPAQVLCSEFFLENYGDLCSKLVSGRWDPNNTNLQRIGIVDSPTIDACGLDIEIPGRRGLMVIHASAMNDPTSAKSIVLGVAKLQATGRYKHLFVLLAKDCTLTTMITKNVIRLQSVPIVAKGLKLTKFHFSVVPLTLLADAIARCILASPSSNIDRDRMIAAATTPQGQKRVLFLMAVLPSLCATGAIRILHLAEDFLPRGAPFFRLLFLNNQVRQQIHQLSTTSGEPDIHPLAMQQLASTLTV